MKLTNVIVNTIVIVIVIIYLLKFNSVVQGDTNYNNSIRNDDYGDGSSSVYAETCPQVEQLVFLGMKQAVQQEPRIAASILRMLFHDCFVQGCDASVLLDDTPNFKGEKTAGPNLNSLRGFQTIDKIKLLVEENCPGVVSCADILALAARDGVALLGGPSWTLNLGRRDSLTASLHDANNNIPAPNSTLETLISKFNAQGLSAKDMVALSGSHTIGFARCVTFKQRLYNQDGTGQQDPTLDEEFAQNLKTRCRNIGSDNNLFPMDLFSPIHFDNHYYTNLVFGEGLLNSDQILLSGLNDDVNTLAQFYARSQDKFFNQFKESMIKMSNIGILRGFDGEIRINCRKRNQ